MNLYTTSTFSKLQSNVSISGYAMSKTSVIFITSFSVRPSWYFSMSHVRTNDFFLKFWNRNGEGRRVLKAKFQFQNMTFYPALDLSSVKCQNECHHRILYPKWSVKHVSHYNNVKFIADDLIWPDLDLDFCLAWVPCLNGTFVIPSEVFQQSFGSQLSLGRSQ